MVKRKDEHLLVIRLSAMGDVAMCVPVLLALTKKNPHLIITVLSRPFFTPIFNKIPNLTVYTIDVKNRHKGILGLYRLSKELRKIPFTAVADLHNVLRTKILKVFLSGGSRPFVQVDKGRTEKKRLTAWKGKKLIPLKTTHERYADVFRQLGFPLELSPEDVLPRIEPRISVREFVDNKKYKTIGIAPFAAFSGKMYPAELMEQVMKSLNNTNKYNIILFGGGEKEIKILKKLENTYSHCYNVAGVLTFEEELSLISNLDLMLSMDSGNGHLSAMFGVPTVNIWGITHPFAGFAPFGQAPENSIMADRRQFPWIPTSVYGNKYPKGYEKAMHTIDPQEIVRKIEAMLN